MTWDYKTHAYPPLMSRQIGSFTLEPEISRALALEAERQGISKSELVNRYIEKGVEKDTTERVVGAAVDAGFGITALVLIFTVAVVLI